MASPLVLLHGFTHTGASWNQVIGMLGKRYRSLAPDIRGHGVASQHDPVTLEAVIADLATLAPKRFTLAGYSMGGRIALHAALALGDRVERLILVSASPGILDPAERVARREVDERLAAEIERSSIEQFAARWADHPVLAGQPADVKAAAHEDRLRNTPRGVAQALRGLGPGALEPVWDRLIELQMPVTLVVGADDPKFRALAAQMSSAIRDAEVVIVPGTGHAVHLEAPACVAAVI